MAPTPRLCCRGFLFFSSMSLAAFAIMALGQKVVGTDGVPTTSELFFLVFTGFGGIFGVIGAICDNTFLFLSNFLSMLAIFALIITEVCLFSPRTFVMRQSIEHVHTSLEIFVTVSILLTFLISISAVSSAFLAYASWTKDFQSSDEDLPQKGKI